MKPDGKVTVLNIRESLREKAQLWNPTLQDTPG